MIAWSSVKGKHFQKTTQRNPWVCLLLIPMFSLLGCQTDLGTCSCLTFLISLNTMVLADWWTWTCHSGWRPIFSCVRTTGFQSSWLWKLTSHRSLHFSGACIFFIVKWRAWAAFKLILAADLTTFSFQMKCSCLVQVLGSPWSLRSRKADPVEIRFPGPHPRYHWGGTMLSLFCTSLIQA